jgi:hypothetical protein
MPDALLTNVAGAEGEAFYTGPQIQDVVNTTTVAIPNGTLCAIATPITTTTTTIFGVAAATSVATTAPLNIGIAVGGKYPTSSIGASGTGQVVIHGHCRALVDSTTTPTVAGHRLIIGGTTAGCLSDSGTTTAAAGLNYGVVLEALTPTTTGTLTNIWFEKT